MRVPILMLLALALSRLPLAAQAPSEAQRVSLGVVPPPRFADPDRVRKLAAAYPEIEQIFRAFAERNHVPGFAFGILVDGELVLVKGVGVRNVATKAPVDADTVFRIASMTKSFTAMAILRLRDEGKLSIEAPAARYVPELAELPYPTRDAPPITVRDLLTHSEGFPEDNPWGDRQLAVSDETMSRWMQEGIPFSNAPGLAFEYSNYGFAILGRIVSRVSGMPYADYVTTHILRPLGMTSTTFEPSAVPEERRANGYRWRDEQWHDEPALAHGAFGAMGGLLTSARDLAKYVAFLMSAFPPRDAPETGPIRRASAREMQQALRHTPATVRRSSVEGALMLDAGGYGYGLRVSQDCRFAYSVSHGGGLPGYGSLMRWLPEHGVGIIAMGNVTYASWGRAFNDAFAALARTGALQPRVVQPSPALLRLQETVSRLILRWDENLASEIAADNLFLDLPADVRREQIAELLKAHGTCRPLGEIEAENALRGTWRLGCERGRLEVAMTLAPTAPPRVQFLSVRGVMPLDDRLAALAARVAELTTARDTQHVAALIAPDADVEKARATLAAAVPWGGCTVKDTVSGDGTTRATVRLSCERGTLYGVLDVNAGAGALRGLELIPDPDQRCVP